MVLGFTASDNFNDGSLSSNWTEPLYLDSEDENTGCQGSSVSGYPFWYENGGNLVGDQPNCDFGGIYYNSAYVFPEYFSIDISLDSDTSSGGFIVGYGGEGTNEPYYRVRYGYDQIYLSPRNGATVSGNNVTSLNTNNYNHNLEFTVNDEGRYNVSVDGTVELNGTVSTEHVTGYTGPYTENLMYFDNFYLSTDNSSSFCDARGELQNECVVNSEKQVSGEFHEIDNIFISEKSSVFEAQKTSWIKITNKSIISGLWTGNFNITADKITLTKGARFRPQNRIIIN